MPYRPNDYCVCVCHGTDKHQQATWYVHNEAKHKNYMPFDIPAHKYCYREFSFFFLSVQVCYMFPSMTIKPNGKKTNERRKLGEKQY